MLMIGERGHAWYTDIVLDHTKLKGMQRVLEIVDEASAAATAAAAAAVEGTPTRRGAVVRSVSTENTERVRSALDKHLVPNKEAFDKDGRLTFTTKVYKEIVPPVSSRCAFSHGHAACVR